MAYGLCRLTQKHGKFVECHLIPRAVTRPSTAGAPFIQTGRDSRPVRRFSSWYDKTLVTRAGEDLLSNIDDAGIKELRKHKLIWSGWGNDRQIPIDCAIEKTDKFGARKISGVDGNCLRLFFLSLLWRAAATSRWEFAQINLNDNDLEQLRQMITKKNTAPPTFFSMNIAQLSTRGENHNHTPVLDEKILPNADTGVSTKIKMFRFYFDGLIIHVHFPDLDGGLIEAWGDLVVGASDNLTVTAIPYETSSQRMHLEATMKQANERWPDDMSRL